MDTRVTHGFFITESKQLSEFMTFGGNDVFYRMWALKVFFIKENDGEVRDHEAPTDCFILDYVVAMQLPLTASIWSSPSGCSDSPAYCAPDIPCCSVQEQVVSRTDFYKRDVLLVIVMRLLQSTTWNHTEIQY